MNNLAYSIFLEVCFSRVNRRLAKQGHPAEDRATYARRDGPMLEAGFRREPVWTVVERGLSEDQAKRSTFERNKYVPKKVDGYIWQRRPDGLADVLYSSRKV